LRKILSWCNIDFNFNVCLLKILKKEKVGFSFCFDVSAPRNAGQTFFYSNAARLKL